MHLHSRPLAVAITLTMSLAAGALAGCASVAPRPSGLETCARNKACTVTGALSVFGGAPASSALLETPTGCVALALTEEDYVRYRRTRNLRVQVTGTAYEQQLMPNLLSYSLRDREVGVGMCSSPLVIYVETMRPR